MTAGAVGSRRRRPVGLYLHVPFCVSRCAYCSFVTSTELGLMPRAMAALATEVGSLARRRPRRLDSLYLGGGTPSLVAPEHVAAVFAAVRRGFTLSEEAEVTLEANPDDVSYARLAVWRSLGVNRLSIGVQAFDDEVLAMLNRRHSAAQAKDAVAAALAAGFEVSLDLMLGLPRLQPAGLAATLEEVLWLRPQHVSVYLLEMDKPHRLAELAGRRPDLFPDDEAAARQYLAAGRALTGAGYRHYEISNFALPGCTARHNVRYWTGAPVLAAGVAAHGQAGRRRWANVDTLADWLESVEQGRPPRAWSRRLDGDEAERESLMLGLRLARGVAVARLRAQFASRPELAGRIDDFLRLGLAREIGDRIRFTPRGWLLSNELLAALF